MSWIKTAVLASLCCTGAIAAPITFTETFSNASGVLDGTAFTSQTITIVMTSDTSTITNPGPGFYFDPGTTTVNVSGVGFDTFTHSLEIAGVQTEEAVVIFDPLGDDELLGIINAGLATYALNTSIGPLSGGTAGNSNLPFATSGGSFEITTSLDADQQATFTASSVPEPGTLGMICSGVGLLLFRRRAAR